jgi:hypothetical protein
MDHASKHGFVQGHDTAPPARIRVRYDRGRVRDRDDRSVQEGWDVGGPRWRIGWGGLPLDSKVPNKEGSIHRR